MTDAPETNLLRELVFEYLERSDAEGPGVLDALCAEHPELADALCERVAILHGSGLSSVAGAEGRPERLGSFRLGERIGGGGMGVVYRAHDEALGREVALKLVRPGELLFPGARERFRREVEAVARLSHPGIVPVYSAGEDGGVPFFAMEKVDGCTLGEALVALVEAGAGPDRLTGADLGATVARLAAEHGLDVGGGPVSPFFDGPWPTVCARIVREVAEALEHAHRRGVLHRDVKPSNVMITPAGRVMLLDFGLSSAEGVERITRTGSAMGSLPFMSPEQLDGDWAALDARSDVYALGVTLYELLTLRLPYEETSVVPLRRAVVEGRSEPVRRRNPGVSWELETVTVTAMDPEPERRYASAAALAQDLSATLEGRPLLARRAGPWRRARRWVALHPAGAALLGLTVLVVVGGPLLFGWQQRRARLALGEKSEVIEGQRKELADKNIELSDALAEARVRRIEAEAQAERAEQNLDSAVAAVDTILTRFAEESLRDVPRLHELRRDVLEDALAFYLGFLEQRADDPALQRETARAWMRVGDLYVMLDRAHESEQALDTAIGLYTTLLEDALDDERLLHELAETRMYLALGLRRLGRQAEAEEHLRRALAGFEHAARSAQDPDRYETQRLGLSLSLAQVLRELGRGEEARALLEEVLPAMEARHEQVPESLERAEHLGTAHGLLGSLLAESTPPNPAARREAQQLAESHHTRALEVLEPALERHPDDTDVRRELARAAMNLGSVMTGRGALEEARAHLERGAELAGRLKRDYPGVVTYAQDEATALLVLGAVRAALGDFDEGIATLREAQAVFGELSRGPTGRAAALQRLASAQLQEGALHWQVAGDGDAALDVLERAVETHERALALAPGMPQMEAGLEWCHEFRSDIRLQAGDVTGAGEAARDWGAVARSPGRQVSAALQLAECAQAAEADEAMPADERDSLAAEYDAAAVRLVSAALDAGLPPQALQDAGFEPLRGRPAVASLLD